MRIIIKKPFNIWFARWSSGRKLVRIGPFIIDALPRTKRIKPRRIKK